MSFAGRGAGAGAAGGQPGARSAHAGLHFVRQHQHTGLGAGCTNARPIGGIGKDHPGLALDGFGQKCRHMGVFQCGFQSVQIVVGNAHKTLCIGSKSGVGVGIRGKGNDGGRPAVEVVFYHHNLGVLRRNPLDVVGPPPGQFYGRFHRFRPGIHGQDLVVPQQLRDFFFVETQLVVVKGPRGKRQLVRLLVERLRDFWVAVPLVDR